MKKNKFLILYCSILIIIGLTLSSCGSLSNDDDDSSSTTSTSEFTLSSSAISDGVILDAYACEEKVTSTDFPQGVESSISLTWKNTPEGTGSLAFTMTHVDVDNNTNFYLLLWNVSANIVELPYNSVPTTNTASSYGYMGSNKDGVSVSYTSPCSAGSGTNSYNLNVYKLKCLKNIYFIINNIS